MSKLYTEIFDKERLAVWKKLAILEDIGALAGGIGLALQLKHRISYDFDIFCEKSIGRGFLLKVRKVFGEENIKTVVDSGDELTVLYKDEIKISFVYFPFEARYKKIKSGSIDLFDVRDLLSNKAYAVGRRGVWRDYIDIFWCLKNEKIDLKGLIKETEKRFDGVFSEKLFLEQLVYFDDIEDMAVEWIDAKISNDEIKKFLSEEVGKYLK
ncbi:hypothetical protein KKA02_01820 [Patescibacteria group bacterium]|nr:hypothetical protein [Patescibacteria group bacterium]